MKLFRTEILMAFLTGLFVAVGNLVGGGPGMVMAFVLAAGIKLFSYWNSDKMVLSMYGARKANEATASRRSTEGRVARVKAIAAEMGQVPQPSPRS